MTKRFLLLAFSLTIFLASSSSAFAQIIPPQGPLDSIEEATDSAAASADIATASAEASPAARIDQKIQEKKEEDITETRGAVKGRLAQFLDENPIGDLTVFNFIQHAIRRAVNQGVPANMLVLMLLFPVIASVIAFSRHVIGLQGYGVYTPAVLAVAFVSMGILPGIVLFLAIILTVTLGKYLVHPLRLEYLPRTALMLQLVSLIVFALLLLSPLLVNVVDLVSIGIFPILVLILLSENFMGSQLAVSQARAIELTVETLALAIACALFIRLLSVQQFVILYPETTLVVVAAVNLLVGKYTGLRLSEYFRFRPILEEEE